jgi:hypothetical protein
MVFKAPLFSFEISLILKYKKVPPKHGGTAESTAGNWAV